MSRFKKWIVAVQNTDNTLLVYSDSDDFQEAARDFSAKSIEGKDAYILENRAIIISYELAPTTTKEKTS